MKTGLTFLFAFFLFFNSVGQYQHEWVRGIVSTGYAGLNTAKLSPDGSVILNGRFTDTLKLKTATDTITLTLPYNKEAPFLAKINRQGDFLWAFMLYDSTSSAHITNMEIDSKGDIFIVGNSSHQLDLNPGPGQYFLPYGTSTFLARYSNQGKFKWAKNLYSDNDCRLFNLSLASDGNILLSGRIEQTFDADPGPASHVLELTREEYSAYAVILDSTGGFKNAWKTSTYDFELGANGRFYSWGGIFRVQDIDLRPNYHYLLTTGASKYGAYIACYNADGSVKWAKKLNNTTGYPTDITDIMVDEDESILYTGSRTLASNEPIPPNAIFGESDMIYAKLDSTGNAVFVKIMGGRMEDAIHDMDGGYGNRVFLSGTFIDSMDVDPSPGYQIAKSPDPTSKTHVIIQYDRSGNLIDYMQLTGWNDLYRVSIICGKNGELYTYGRLDGIHSRTTIDFDLGPGTDTLSTSRIVGFIQKLNIGSLGEREREPEPAVSIFPNPSTGEFFITGDEEIVKISVYNHSGALLKTMNPAPKREYNFKIKGSPGLYLVSLQFTNGIVIWEKVIKQ